MLFSLLHQFIVTQNAALVKTGSRENINHNGTCPFLKFTVSEDNCYSQPHMADRPARATSMVQRNTKFNEKLKLHHALYRQTKPIINISFAVCLVLN